MSSVCLSSLQNVINEKEPGRIRKIICWSSLIPAVWLKFVIFTPPSPALSKQKPKSTNPSFVLTIAQEINAPSRLNDLRVCTLLSPVTQSPPEAGLSPSVGEIICHLAEVSELSEQLMADPNQVAGELMWLRMDHHPDHTLSQELQHYNSSIKWQIRTM